MQIIDTRGQLCPAPLIITKRAIKDTPHGGQFTILADNDTACQNLLSFLSEMGIQATCTKKANESHIVFATDGKVITLAQVQDFCDISKTGGHIVAIKSETMGAGSDELGLMLMRSCINSLLEVEPLPQAIIMYNGGVRLATKEKDTAQTMTQLASKGVKIVVCGACVDFFAIKDELIDAAQISNMYKINTMLATASSVVYP